jgi:hypothetical protein
LLPLRDLLEAGVIAPQITTSSACSAAVSGSAFHRMSPTEAAQAHEIADEGIDEEVAEVRR